MFGCHLVPLPRSILVLPILRLPILRLPILRLPILRLSRRRGAPYVLCRAKDVEHAGRGTDKEEHDQPPRPRPEHSVEAPADRDPDGKRRDQLDREAERQPERTLRRGAAAGSFPPELLPTRLFDLFAKPRQRIWRLLGHSEKRFRPTLVPAAWRSRRGGK